MADTSTTQRRVALVTGASRGIGAGIVAALRRDGYSVVAVSRSIDRRDEDGHVAIRGDVTDPDDAGRAVDRALERFGRLDTLVNNAGVFIEKPFSDYTREDLARLVGVNVEAFFNVTQPAIAAMAARGSGHVVSVTTSIVERASSERPSALVALTKGGLAAATRSLAIEYASRGVRVNAIAPGVVRTPEHDADSYRGLDALHPLGRVAEIEDVVKALLYLEAATFVTGETLHVDGGQAAGR
ncbi:MAG TPA: SDR family oxidoreductase [Solirubrobacteraceae bacterium]|nr:SDR family oxidoreductase [Solirubrobacteraceae bacterium]